MFIPRLQELSSTFFDDLLYLSELVRGEAARFRERYLEEPELCHRSIPLHVNVRWFIALIAVEEEAIRPNVAYVWHRKKV
jgi:hypothetical protein